MPSIFRPYASFIAALVLLTVLLFARMAWHGSTHFAFLVWNLFLAVLPLVASHIVLRTRRKPLAYLCAVAWLLFFPNSAYLLTDIVHLQMRRGASFWLDLTLLFGAGLFGVTVAIQSLFQMETWYGNMMAPRYAQMLTVLILLASGYGIYLGRIERWNSWDIVCNTWDLLSVIAYELRHPFRCREAWMLSSIFAAALGLAYFTLGRRQLRR